MSYVSSVGYSATRIRGNAVVKTFPPPWNMLVWKKVATRLRSYQDVPSPWYTLVGEKSGYAATRLRSCEDHPSVSKYVCKERSGYAATWLRSDCVAA